jgi:hypothetical protein
LWIIGNYRFYTNHDRLMSMTQCMNKLSRGLPANPFAVSGTSRYFPIQGSRSLQSNPRNPSNDVFIVGFIHHSRFLFAHPNPHFDAMVAQLLYSCTSNNRVRIRTGNYDPFDPFRDKPLGARWCPSVVAAGLQGYINRTAFRFGTCHQESINLGMMGAPLQMSAHSHNPSILHNDTAYNRIDACLTASLLGHLERKAHIRFIV